MNDLTRRRALRTAIRAALTRLERPRLLTLLLAADERLTTEERAAAIGCSIDEFRESYAGVVAGITRAIGGSGNEQGGSGHHRLRGSGVEPG
jgi:hypothetical protein